MPRSERQTLIRQMQEARGGRLLISYVTSTRAGHEIQISDDVLRLIYDHLEAGKEAAKVGVDVFIHSNGGSGTVPWRLVSLIREYAKSFAVLVPHRAFSAATLLALGADEIVMHKMGCLGPIDPSVWNLFNPPHPQIPGQFAPISVEDVTAFIKLVKDEVGITHEDELIQAFTSLCEKIHPLALGNVQRSHNQSRMLATKLLKQHMSAEREHEISKIVDNLKSNLFFHGHPINRAEAKNDLNLKVSLPSEDLEKLMWDLYIEYEKQMELTSQHNPLHEMDVRAAGTSGPSPTVDDIINQMQQLGQRGIRFGPGALTEDQMVRLASALHTATAGRQVSNNKVRLEGLIGAYIESAFGTEVFKTDLAFERSTVLSPSGPQDALKQEVLWQRWEKES